MGVSEFVKRDLPISFAATPGWQTYAPFPKSALALATVDWNEIMSA